MRPPNVLSGALDPRAVRHGLLETFIDTRAVRT